MGFEPGSTTIKRTSCLTYPLDHGSFFIYFYFTYQCKTYKEMTYYVIGTYFKHNGELCTWFQFIQNYWQTSLKVKSNSNDAYSPIQPSVQNKKANRPYNWLHVILVIFRRYITRGIWEALGYMLWHSYTTEPIKTSNRNYFRSIY